MQGQCNTFCFLQLHFRVKSVGRNVVLLSLLDHVRLLMCNSNATNLVKTNWIANAVENTLIGGNAVLLQQ